MDVSRLELERIEMLNWDRQILEWQMKKFGWSTYAVAWIAFIKGIIIGLLVYHFIIQSLIQTQLEQV
jgi:hypothetical protein